jgi:hypothetical protein
MTDTHKAPTLAPELVAGLRSGDRDRVRAAISGLPRRALAAWLSTPDGEEVLRDAFRRMPDFYVPGLITEPVTTRWVVRRAPGEPIEYDLDLKRTRCVLGPPDPRIRPAVTLTLDGTGFVELACAARRGVSLLLHRQLHIKGDVSLAMRMESFFGLDARADR